MSTFQTSEPDYGTSKHYRGKKGEIYFLEQKTTGRVGASWNLNFWVPHIDAEDSVLDFGCGGGYLLSLLPPAQKAGVEINPAARLVATGLGLEVVPTLDDLHQYSFTRVISSHALEHIPSPLVALKQLRERIIQGGKLVLLLPLDDWRGPSQHTYKHEDVNHHLYAWTPQNLGNLICEAGFSDIKVKIITDAMPPNIKIANILMKNNTIRRWVGYSLGFVLRRRQLFAVASP